MKNVKKRLLCAVLSAGVMLTNTLSVTNKAFADTKDGSQVIADWRFDSSNVKSGSISDKNLIIKDSSGNGNELRMNTYGEAEDYSKYLGFSDDTMYGATNGSLVMTGDSENKIGADLITVDEAPINKEEFENGYTMEFIYKLPTNWTAADSWMGLLARQGNAKSMDEPEVGTMSVAVSNCKEIQFLTANKEDNHGMESAAWSVSMDKGGVWYHIAIVSDNNSIRTYVNGAEAFRNYVSNDMTGLYADPDDGRFRVGSSWWKEGDKTLDKFAKGSFQQIRISEGALDKSQWLISNPEQYVGEYGNNDPFSLKAENNYNMVFMPDTQNAIKFKPGVMDAAMDWLTENRHAANIISVTHLGDVVENGNNEEQWNTTKLFSKLPEAEMKLLMQPGNHDWPEYYDRYFGADSEYGRLTSDYVVRTSPSGRSTYMVTDGGSYKYMTLAIDYHSFDSDLPWVEEVLSNTNMPTVITSHDLQNCSDTAPSEIKLSKKGQQVWDVVKKYNQVFMVIGGHSHGAGNQILINDQGNEVLSILADYQFAHNGGNALFKFAEFNEVANKIYLSTFSPYAATIGNEERTFFDVNYLTGVGNYSEFEFNFEERFAGMEKSDAVLQEAKNELKTLIEEVKGLDREKYTGETWSVVKEALTKAQNVSINENVEIEEIKEVYNGLKAAVEALVEKEMIDIPSEEDSEEDVDNNGNIGSGGSQEENNSNGSNNSNIQEEDKNNGTIDRLPQTGGGGTFGLAFAGTILAASGFITLKKFKK
ncbi:MAG: LamG-like jellyroll fold domain-containing protein [Clostridium sp.]|nr:LamG-like jellyroll fold domain-containing protein [Clostridium sp.]MDU7083133.1 LamG-like jellyroll fold domain-containing protein [Clostridium sp.]